MASPPSSALRPLSYDEARWWRPSIADSSFGQLGMAEAEELSRGRYMERGVNPELARQVADQ
jgi:hypothetical protein